MGNATRLAFEANIENFLRDHALIARAGWASATKSGVGDVRAASGAPVFVMGGSQTGVRLDAPLVEAYFEKHAPAVEPHILPFSRPTVDLKLDAPGTNPKSMANVYLIPYQGGRGHGVKLPSQATDGLPVAYAVTAAQQGCTVEVSGTAAEPYASHTNVIDAHAPARQAMIHTRLAQLQADYLAAEQAAGLPGGAPNPAAVNRSWFGHYAPPGALGVQDRNYTNASHGVVQAQLQNAGNPRTIKVAHRENLGMAGHRNFRFRINPGSIVLNPAAPAQAQVVARRVAGNWTFYYQVWNPIQFQVIEKSKFGKITYHQDIRQVTVSVVLAWGQLWPHYTQNLVAF